MRYADNHCFYRETADSYIYTGPCVMTGEIVTVNVKSSELFAYRQGVLIQNALKSNTDAEREFLISGVSEKAFESLCGDND
jgi:hypothetical protein